MTTDTTIGKDLLIIENLNAVEVFATPGGLDPVLEFVEKEARSVVLDVSTAKGREDIRSVAYKVKKSRTALFKMAKDLTEDWREQTKKVTSERNRMEERLVELEEDVRRPLTEFENKEKNRVDGHEAALLAITLLGEAPADLGVLENAVLTIDADDRDWEEFADRARRTKEQVREVLSENLGALKKAAAEKAELERLRAAEAARLQKEREDKIAADAADNARIEAERVAKDAADKESARVKAEQERIEEEKRQAELRATKAEADRILAEKKAKDDADALAAKVEADKKAASEKAAKDADAAAKKERDRIEAEKKAEADAAAKREADLAHRKKINNEVLTALEKAVEGSDEDAWAKDVITAIAKGLIPHVRISY